MNRKPLVPAGKVSRANAQSRLSGILCSLEHGKLCFLLLTSFPATQNHLPLTQGRDALRSRASGEKIQALCIAPLKSNSMMATEKRFQRLGGRKPKADPAVFRYSVSFNEAEHNEFLSRFERSGMKVKAHFIASCIFDRELKVVKIDKAAMDYYMRLTTFHSQFRAIGTNYNQITKAIKATFTEKKALAFLYQLEKATMELVAIHKKVMDLTDEFERKYLIPNP